MAKITKDDVLEFGFIAGFLGTIIYAAVATYKLNVISEKLDRSVKDLYYDKKIEIPDTLIQKAVENAAADEARYQVPNEMAKARKQIVSAYHEEIKSVVEEEFEKQKADVAKALKRKVSDLDISSIKREVIREAKDACAEKFKDDLETISEKYTDQIDSLVNIYSTVAEKVSRIGD